jgi:hypothetical protein
MRDIVFDTLEVQIELASVYLHSAPTQIDPNYAISVQHCKDLGPLN